MEQTPFKAVFTKKSNFVTQSFDTDPLTIDYGGDSKFLVPRHGDFITKMYLLIDYASVTSSKINHALAMIDYVSLIIGGTTIQQESGETINLRLNVEGTEKQSFSVVQLFRMLRWWSVVSFHVTRHSIHGSIAFKFHYNFGFMENQTWLSHWRHCVIRKLRLMWALRNSENWGGADSGITSSDVRLRIEYGYAPDEVVKSVMSRPLDISNRTISIGGKGIHRRYFIHVKPYFVNPVKAVFALFKDKTTDTTNIFDYSRGNPLPLSNGPKRLFDLDGNGLDNEVLMPKEVGTFEMYRGFQYYAHFPGSAQDIVSGSNRYCGFIYALAFCKDPMNRTIPNGSINFSTIINPLFNVECKGNSSNAIRFRLYALSMNLLYIENGISRLLFTGSEATLPRFL
jgi:hypothetical protein